MEELNNMLFRGKCSNIGMKRMNEAGLLPVPEKVNEWKQSFVGCFLVKNYKYYGIILKIKEIIGRVPRWKDFTKSNIREIVNYYLNECAQSSARTYMALIRLVLNDHDNKDDIPCKNFADELSVKNTPSVPIYLTMDDINRIDKYKPKNEREAVVRAQFLCACYTGARHSDILRMTNKNINGKYLTYVSQKTKRTATVEAKKGLSDLLVIAKKRTYSDYIFNDTIRDICRKSGIKEQVRVFHAGEYKDGEKWQFVSSHTARRSFASNLSELGVPIRQISLRMGHSNTIMTERYIVSPGGKLTEEAMTFFE